MLELVKINGNCLEHASDELCDDFDIVDTAVTQNREALRFASDRIRGENIWIFARSI